MKKFLLTLIAILTTAVSADAMSYEQAQKEALFLTDKMAYELNLTDEQYEAAFEINMDYLMSVSNRNEVFGSYWDYRNRDFRAILYPWQWDLFFTLDYFYRPLYWEAGFWHFRIYTHYPHRNYFYFGRPHFYVTYRGGHSWHAHGNRSYYEGRHNYYRPSVARENHNGMRTRLDKGTFHNSSRGSSTRVTVNRDRGAGNNGNRYDRGINVRSQSDRDSHRDGQRSDRHGDRQRQQPGNGSVSRPSTPSGSENGSSVNRERSSSNQSSRTFGGSSSSSRAGSPSISGRTSGSQSSGRLGGPSISGGSRNFGGGSSSAGSRGHFEGSRSGRR